MMNFKNFRLYAVFSFNATQKQNITYKLVNAKSACSSE